MRRTKLTYDLIDKAAALKADGLSNVDIVAALGINQSTFYRWLQRPDTKLKRELKERLKKAEGDYKHELLTTIREAARTQTNSWTAAAWLLERKYPDEFGRPERRGEKRDETTPTIVLGVGVAKAGGDREGAR